MSGLTDALKAHVHIKAIEGDLEALRPIVAAARRVADAEEIWWCEEHYLPAPDWLTDAQIATCWRWVASQTVEELPEYECRMVRKLLVDP